MMPLRGKETITQKDIIPREVKFFFYTARARSPTHQSERQAEKWLKLGERRFLRRIFAVGVFVTNEKTVRAKC